MVNRRTLMGGVAVGGVVAALGFALGMRRPAAAAGAKFEITKSEAEWRKILTPEQYYVLRDHGTERAGTSPLDHEKRKGTFSCAGCDLPVYSSETKFDSGTGWPSFWKPLPNAIGTSVDTSLFSTRTEVHCRRCGGHLGHVFEDGPAPTGLRYCMNGVAMKFKPAAAA
ncbi:MAG: peptide-methionine (R)-S-oxide reductase MsrB [Alphaproteobacteria bacterium]|nr:peptide-methionine (R)-S-oxide reductase MsrB [Alphaproteobacteria bacterium]